ncbi:hypothetical protein DV515_00005021 [Chloebia gouldiae]|uniref:Uncharacterized protein n=1 Tax=Chloebia gouldiae TaxID=44316 RepID=A0A3L8SP13_CHLGU|nr:hypothetical protein DV515_00005021 [Chloebia gouldiae]
MAALGMYGAGPAEPSAAPGNASGVECQALACRCAGRRMGPCSMWGHVPAVIQAMNGYQLHSSFLCLQCRSAPQMWRPKATSSQGFESCTSERCRRSIITWHNVTGSLNYKMLQGFQIFFIVRHLTWGFSFCACFCTVLMVCFDPGVMKLGCEAPGRAASKTMGISLKEAEENSCAETVPTFTLSTHCQKCFSTISLLYRVTLAWSLRNKMDVSEEGTVLSAASLGEKATLNIAYEELRRWKMADKWVTLE